MNAIRAKLRKAFQSGTLQARQVRSDGKRTPDAEWKTAQAAFLTAEDFKAGPYAWAIKDLGNGVFLLSRAYADFEVR